MTRLPAGDVRLSSDSKLASDVVVDLNVSAARHASERERARGEQQGKLTARGWRVVRRRTGDGFAKQTGYVVD